ncbi:MULTISPECIES: lateral flagellar basal body rod protein LfgB [Aeromonas]|uniref:lateral flagellar basal body rod protein LfgB n=1 Tax=Aeromonas TaxID=642 RepID=UPI0013D26EBE|nr:MULTISPECIES: lateral flagellar basal body rod protein LfgB [Aeromonas]MBS4701435.1 lateral flagellar basal body rod protein LfgB [Aeromonas media]NEX82312.1 flagellar basal body rod protein FlgB [Aeromonas rivipollensis]QIY87819.1 lateral flagellar basal body rod protein LfgB [Aeromonas hydrophila]
MSISFDSALGVHPYALDVRADRARILAGNLANVDTPGYLARDVDYKSILGRVARQVAAGEQGSAISQGDTDMQHPLYRIPYQVSMDGNTAELSVEQSKFASNATDFQTSLTFLNMKITGIAKAIEGR